MGEGEAANWAQPLLQKHLEGAPHNYLQTWKAFKEAFLLSFSDPVKKEKAIREINKLAQIGSAQQYATKFRTLMEDLNWDIQALINNFKTGLKPEIQQELLKQAMYNQYKSQNIEDWIEMAIKIDDLFFATKDLARDQPHFNQRDPIKQRTTNKGRTSRVPAEEMKQRRDNNLCLKCGKPGHRVKDCRSKDYTWEGKTAIPGKAASIKDNKEDSHSTESEN